MKRNRRVPFILLALVVIGVVGAAAFGVVSIPLSTLAAAIGEKLGFSVAHVDDADMLTLWELRMPRIVMSLLVGASLALCGAVFQSIFRNPICDPYILGISSGASLGAAIAFILGWNLLFFGITLPALFTALLTLLLLLGVSRLSRRRSVETLLLAGITLNFMLSAVITLLVVYNQGEMQKIIFWTMGSLATVSWSQIGFALPIMVICVVVLCFYAKNITIMQLGEDTARSLGVNTRRTTVMALGFSSVLIAVVVSFCGVIGFIGLIVPHIARMLVGNHNRAIFLSSMLLGAFCLLLADTLARTVAAPSELPVGAVTAIAGAPYFIFLLLRNKKM
jgi:iron complex transport system permease protein